MNNSDKRVHFKRLSHNVSQNQDLRKLYNNDLQVAMVNIIDPKRKFILNILTCLFFTYS